MFTTSVGRGVLGGLRCGLGGRSFLYRLRAAFMGATSIVYEGKPVGTPDPGAFWRVISQQWRQGLVTAPTAIRAIKREDFQENFSRSMTCPSSKPSFWPAKDLIRILSLGYRPAAETGYRPLVADRNRLGHRRELPGLELFPIKPGSATMPMPGYDIKISGTRHRPGTGAQ